MTQLNRIPKVLVVHGPNLNMLGKREPQIYGSATLDQVNASIQALGKRLGVSVEAFVSNHEGEIVEKIQRCAETHDAVIINPAAYTHTSIAIRDALLLLDVPVVEVHLTNIHKREPFRHTSMISDVVTGRICGFGIQGYSMALEALSAMIKAKAPAGRSGP